MKILILVLLPFIYSVRSTAFASQPVTTPKTTADLLLKNFDRVNNSTAAGPQCKTNSPLEKCQAIHDYLKHGLALKKSTADQLSANILKSKASILFVGEGHDDLVVKENTNLLLAPLLAEKGTCLMLEMPPGLQGFLNKLDPNEDLKKVAINAAQKIVSEKTDGLTYNEQQRLVEEATPELMSWMKLAMEAKKAGNSTFAIDVNPSNNSHGTLSDEGMAARNKEMAKNLAAKINSGECKKEISINGVAHVVKNRADGKLKSLPVLMDEKGIKSHLFVNVRNPYVIDIDSGCSIDDLQPLLIKGELMFSEQVQGVNLFRVFNAIGTTDNATYLPVNSSEDITIGLVKAAYAPADQK